MKSRRSRLIRTELLAAEIGSTTTVVSAFAGLGDENGDACPRLLGQGLAPTSVGLGDVRIGLETACRDLARRLGTEDAAWDTITVASSAAGGLRMTVHGLVPEMTVRAAREAVLGAGALIRLVTAGVLQPEDLARVAAERPRVLFMAGGTDFGESDTVIHNARALASLGLDVPVVYAGNASVAGRIRSIFEQAGMECHTAPNVYPRIDQLEVEPARRLIQAVFEKHIVRAPGLEGLAGLSGGGILPTPGAVMESARLLYEEIGDLVVVDVGGATTDVHSVTPGAPELAGDLAAPEPLAKRTVEGDLGVFANAKRVMELAGEAVLSAGIAELAGEMAFYHQAGAGAGARAGTGAGAGAELASILDRLEPLPKNPQEAALFAALARFAARAALLRHAGRILYRYGPRGRERVVEGKDLTAVKWIIGTGGPLSRLPGGLETLRYLRDTRPAEGGGPPRLLPGEEAGLLLDHDYIMAAAGTFARRRPKAALVLLKRSLGLREACAMGVKENH